MTCPRCGFQSPGDFRHCGGCGAPLAGPAPAPAAGAERRRLTVLFCDLVGSTALSTQLDPEELRGVIRAYQRAAVEVVERFAGHVAQYLGDGILVYFGYPEAREDDATSAVRAAFGMVEAVRRLDRQSSRLAVRIGIHTGPVVVGEVGSGTRRETLALGETPNVAARLQALAEPDAILLSGATHQLVHRAVACEALGTQQVKGLDAPIELYRALHALGDPRVSPTVPSLSPFVGRAAERAALERCVRQLERGMAQIALVTGEPGIGKTRLIQSVLEDLEARPTSVLRTGCLAQTRTTVLGPIVDLLERLFAFAPDEAPAQRSERLVQELSRVGLGHTEAVSLLAALLGLPPDERYALPDVAPPVQRARTFQALRTLVASLATAAPTTLVLEDLHWADPSTLEFMDLLVGTPPDGPLLVLLSARPEFTRAWDGDHVTRVTVDRLAPPEVESLVTHVTRHRALPQEVVQTIVARTDGVPLFVEELTRSVLESGALRPGPAGYELVDPEAGSPVPATLHDSLMAQLDRLGPAKQVAQAGSVLGRTFSAALAAAVIEWEPDAVERALDRLVVARLLERQGDRLSFRHALIQDTAYDSLLRERRRTYHGRAAAALAATAGTGAAVPPDLLAHHYTEAGAAAEAVTGWLAAGQLAAQRAANAEAVTLLRRGLGLVDDLPDQAPRWQQELALQSLLGQAVSATQGFAAPDVERAFARALALCRQLGDRPDLFWSYWGLWSFHVVRAELATARELALELGRLADGADDDALRMEALFALGSTDLFRGDLVAAREILERGLEMDRPDRDRRNMFVTGQDVGVTTRSYLAQTLWYLGAPDRALALCQDAVALARRIAHPFSLVGALNTTASIHQLRREPAAVREREQEVIALSEEKGFFWQAQGNVLLGWAEAVEAADTAGVVAGLERIRSGYVMARASGARLTQTYGAGIQAEVALRAGRLEDAARHYEDGVAAAYGTGERFWEVELHRLRGRLALAQNDAEFAAGNARQAAEHFFQQAVNVAFLQRAGGFGLRAATDLARLWMEDGRTDAAHALLRRALDAMDGGDDTADVRAARALLAAEPGE